MKKIFSSIATCMALILCFSACSTKEPETSSESVSSSSSVSTPETSNPEDGSSEDSTPEDSSPEDSSGNESGGNEGGGNESGGNDNPTPTPTPTYTYTDFTASEKNTLREVIGEVIPFVATNEYYLKQYYYDYGDEQENGVNYYTFDNTQADFNAYLEVLSARYESAGSDVDDYGDTWYFFEADDYYIDISYYQTDEKDYCIDMYAYTLTSGNQGGGNESGGSEGGGNTPSTEYTYTDFTASEKSNFISTIGEVIPFMPTNEYEVDSYSDDDSGDVETGINYYTFDNTQADFEAYLEVLSARYESAGSDVDNYGDTWYFFEADDYYIDVAYYYYDGAYCMDLYAYYYEDGANSDDGEWDDFWDDDDNSGNQGGGSNNENITHITNDGKGLPAGTNGVHNVDFTKAKYVKDVTDQGYYLDGCPTVGKPSVLVLPVEFSDCTAASKGYSIDKIKAAFNGGTGTTDYYSVHDYYYLSSYGKLDIQFTVLDSWFKPKNTSSYYANQTSGSYDEPIGDQMVIDEALAYLESRMDLSQFDSDGNNVIDAVVVINTLNIDESAESIFHWAYRYWNMYTDDNGDYYEYDGVSANDYLWAPYQFLYESGNGYNDKNAMNTYTFIHEFGHVLGADDYYDTAYVGSPMGGNDMMDSATGDHNAYTKFNYGWLTSSRLVTASSSVTLTLDAFAKNGDTILIANNWDDELGAYQEYFLVVYYTNDGLNSGVGGYFEEEGILVYHINASLYKEIYEGETYYDVYNNNTDPSDPDGYGTEDNLIELVSSSNGYVFEKGDSLSASTKDSNGKKIAYTFKVDNLTGDSATLTFTKNA